MIKSDILGFFKKEITITVLVMPHVHSILLTWEQPGAPHTYGLSCLSFMSYTSLQKQKKWEEFIYLQSQITAQMSSPSRQPEVPCFIFTRIIHILFTYYRAFIVEAMCNEIVATDDGCFFLRHNIKLTKMIPLVPTDGGRGGAQQSRVVRAHTRYSFLLGRAL